MTHLRSSTFVSRSIAFLFVALGLTLFASTVQSENWPRWRGPERNGISSESSLPTKWTKEENVAWRIPLPGHGGATPIVWDDRIFVTSAENEDLVLLCISTDGEERWKKKLGTGNVDVRGGLGNSASPTPITDGKNVWCTITQGNFHCLTVDGEPVWEFDLQERYGAFDIAFGMTATPVIHEGVIYMQLIHGDGDPETQEAKVVAFNAKDGSPIWDVPRPSDARAECEQAYASCILYQDAEQQYLLTHGADYIVAHDLKDGHELWRSGGMNPKDDPDVRYEPTLRFVATPSASPGYIVVPSAKNGPILCLKPNGSGDITNDESAYHWKRDKNTPDVACPLIAGGLVYFVRENGALLCLDLETGEEQYLKSFARGQHFASPVLAGGNLYVNSFSGKMTVVKAGNEYIQVAQNDFGETLTASPAISNGTIYFRTFDALWAIKNDK
ncbi:outer membrane biogenesis protein BamB [Polystyrenella longa]|uniref:Outer membrane biogenesis protein BamB n=1 Tax=Polystyrenella longa TaxID=2528007 RepID=A0A518CP14_9PLAN|nr:PQQ-binding-like beta-propeller repeat protein [Polystyrenella longa]QDU80958.1 outer membrane biogenesis protein BamB [Polystyrenella longa]